MSLTGKALKHIDSMQDDIPGIRRRRTQEWFSHVQSAPQDDDSRSDGIISQLCRCIYGFFNDILGDIEERKGPGTEVISEQHYRVLDNTCDNFGEWEDRFQVGVGGLDDALKDSQDARQFTLRIMIRICETLTNDLLPHILDAQPASRSSPTEGKSSHPLLAKAMEIKQLRDEASLHAQSQPDSDDTGSSTDTPESDKSSLDEVLESLKSDVEILIDYGPYLEDPIRDTIIKEPTAPPPELTEFTKYQMFFDGIKQKYPQCDDGLAKAMSKCLYDTTMRLHGERQVAATPHSPLAVFRGKLPKDSGYGTSIRDLSHISDGPLDDSIAAGSSYARTLASYAEVDDNGNTKTPFPSQPKELRIGQKFPCIACGRQVAKSEKTSAWKRHVLSDLRPWVCCQISCDCARIPYRSRNEWLIHLQAQHEVHPDWDDRNCPFCRRKIDAGGFQMIHHVERHLRHLSLAALTANPGNDESDSDSDRESDTPMPRTAIAMIAVAAGRGTGPLDQPLPEEPESESLEHHPLFTHAVQEEDGLWHCPWEGEDYCEHKPSVLRADFNKFIRQHLESLRCKVPGCLSAGKAFATQEILYLHEQKEHDMHKGGGRFLCTSPGCGRSRPGNGFANRWVQLEHIKNVHDNIPDLPAPEGS